MQKPWYQVVILGAASVAIGALTLGEFLHSVVSAKEVFKDPNSTYFGTAFLLVIWAAIVAILRRYKPVWVFGENWGWLTRLGRHYHLMIIGMIVLLWVPRLIERPLHDTNDYATVAHPSTPTSYWQHPPLLIGPQPGLFWTPDQQTPKTRLFLETHHGADLGRLYNAALGVLPNNDRTHVISLYAADNKIGLLFDGEYHGSHLYNMMRDLASTSLGITIIAGLQPREPLPTFVTEPAGNDMAVTVTPFRKRFGAENYVSAQDGVPGQTLRPLRGLPKKDSLYSLTDATRVAVDITETMPETAATIAHEVVHAAAIAHGTDLIHSQDGESEAKFRDAESAAKSNAAIP